MSRHPSNSLADSDAGPREHWAPLVDDLPPNSRPSPAEIEQYVNPTVHATTSPSVALTTPAEAAQDKENAANQADITPMGLGTKDINYRVRRRRPHPESPNLPRMALAHPTIFS